MSIIKLSDGIPSVLAIGPYGGELKTFDGVVTTKLLDELKKLAGVYCVHPFETDYGDMPEVDFTMSLGPPSRIRMLDEDPSYRQKYDREISFQDVTRRRTRVARIILQEFPWSPPQNKGALNFSFGPPGNMLLPPQWGKGWFKHGGVYFLYPFADKQESRPEKKEDFVFVDCSDQWDGNWDFSKPAIQALNELGVKYFRASHDLAKRIPRADFIDKINRAKLYLHIKAESYGLTLMEAVASEAIVIGTRMTLRTPYINEFGLKTVPTTGVETLKRAITMALEAYDKPEVREHLRAMREKMWDYGRLAREIAEILVGLKNEKLDTRVLRHQEPR